MRIYISAAETAGGFNDRVDLMAKSFLALGTDIVTDGNAGASSVSFQTSSHKIGGRVQFCCNAAGTLWLMRNLSPPGCVITVA